MLKSILISLLERQARRLLQKNKPRIVAITGSIGKTSTKLFTVTVLSQRYRVLAHEGNHNTEVSLPLSVFDMEVPDRVKSIRAWLGILRETRRQLRQPFPYDVVVLELGTDKPGDIAHFGRYLHADIAVVTAVVPEHMEFFKTLDAVAAEELTVLKFSDFGVINGDDIEPKYRQNLEQAKLVQYGLEAGNQYRYSVDAFEPVQGFSGSFISPEYGSLPVNLKLLGEHNIKSAVAAGAVAARLGLSGEEITAGLQKIRPVAGRMQLLRGMKDSILIDDTYNSSPTAALAALQTLYNFANDQRIAILGSMNELGDTSEEAHKQVGLACDPVKIEWVITVGADAEKYLAPAARSRGCQVESFMSALDAGAFAHRVLRPRAVVLAKGSQNRVFTEEALKELLHETEDQHRLVRQTPAWLAIKDAYFSKFPATPQPVAEKSSLTGPQA